MIPKSAPLNQAMADRIMRLSTRFRVDFDGMIRMTSVRQLQRDVSANQVICQLQSLFAEIANSGVSFPPLIKFVFSKAGGGEDFNLEGDSCELVGERASNATVPGTPLSPTVQMVTVSPARLAISMLALASSSSHCC
jgi:hypothetical protein